MNVSSQLEMWERYLAELVTLAGRTGQSAEFSRRALALAAEAKASGNLKAAGGFQRISDQLLRQQAS
jgi:hypothetical protein